MFIKREHSDSLLFVLVVLAALSALILVLVLYFDTETNQPSIPYEFDHMSRSATWAQHQKT